MLERHNLHFSSQEITVLVLRTGVLAVYIKMHRESPQLSGIGVGEYVLPQSPFQFIYEVPFQSDYIYSKQDVLTHHGVMTEFVTEGRAADVCRDFSKAFDTGSLFFSTKCGLRRSGWGGKAWADDEAQRVMFPVWTWMPAVNGVSTCLFWNLSCPMALPVECALTGFSDYTSWGDQAIYWGIGLPAIVTETICKNDTTGTLWNSTRTNTKSCTREERGPCTDVGQDVLSLVKEWLWGHTITQEKPPSIHGEVAGDEDELFSVILSARMGDSHH